MSYTELIDGVPVTSNVPFNVPQQKGASYSIDIHWTVPISYLLQLGYDLSSLFQAQAIVNEIARLEGATVTLANFTLSSPDPSTTRISFSASSPPVLIVILAILGVAAVIVYLISNATITVVQSLGPAVPILGAAIGIAIITGVGIIGYTFFKSPEFRAETGKSLTAATRYTRERVAPAVARGVSRTASFAQKGISQLSQSVSKAVESEEP